MHCIPRALAALRMELYNPIECPTAAHVQLQCPSGNVVTLRTARLRHRDKCRLLVPYASRGTDITGRSSPSRAKMTRGRRR